MRSEVVYMLGIVAAGFAVNFGLRALPFVLFAGRNRELPRWVERFGAFVSPVIIAALIFYSYSGLAWKTAYPYLAGALVVFLQVWKRNPLVSIVAGTVLYMTLLTCGCATSRSVVEIDAEHPELRLTETGIYMGETRVPPEDIVETLEDAGIPKDRAIHIGMECDMKNLKTPQMLRAILARGGYTRSVLVTKRHAESVNLGKKKRTSASSFGSAQKVAPVKRIRYKKANE